MVPVDSTAQVLGDAVNQATPIVDLTDPVNRSEETHPRHVSWAEVYALLKQAPPGKLWGIPRGGQIVAGLTGRAVDRIEDADWIVDDIEDSGRTFDRYQQLGHKKLWALIVKGAGEGWVTFPWEGRDMTSDLRDTVIRQLESIGEDPMREGLLETPRRYISALHERCRGYQEDPAKVLGTTFEAKSYDQIVILRGIRFASTCEHHLLPFVGTASVGYLPKDRVVGLSKLARVVQIFAHRLQIQEGLTEDIANAIEDHLHPRGVAVVLRASHSCMGVRGVIQPEAEMVTSALRGVFLENPSAMAEFIGLAG